jgi:hypothetical protein
MLSLATWSVSELFWGIPLFFAVHNAEEAPQMARWSRSMSLKWMLTVSTLQFVVAVVLLTALVLGLTALAADAPPGSAGVYVLTGVQAIIFVNAFGHFGLALYMRRYNPGLVTALLFNLPFSLYLFRRLLTAGYVAPLGLGLTLIAAVPLMALLTRGSLRVGARVQTWWSRRRVE